MRRVALVGLVLIVVWLPVARADAADWTVSADALGSHGEQHIDYPAWSSETHGAPWMSVGPVGDVNGDGLEDLAAGFAGTPWTQSSVYVTFSNRDGGVGDVLAFGGFRILADWYWHGVSSAGDVNGDGFGDVAVLHTDKVSVVFGKPDAGTVDTANLLTQGFTITGAGRSVSRGFNGINVNTGVVSVGDLNGDGVRDLLIGGGGSTAIVYPPRLAAGLTIDASRPGPFVSHVVAPDLQDGFVDTLGDIDGDSRDDVLVAGEGGGGGGQAAYGVVSPQPGTRVDVTNAVDEGRAFELTSSGVLENALSLADQNGDGRREVGLVGGSDGVRTLRVAFSPALGTKTDIHDLGAVDERGYAFHAYSNVIDVGDQNLDGRGDFATSSYVYFTDPSLETGQREPVYSGFYFEFKDYPGWATVVAPISDLNGDSKPELAVARVHVVRNSETEWRGENATYSVDVFDSAGAPEVPAPEPPVLSPEGSLEVPVEIATGAGSRGGRSLGLHPRLELATDSGPAAVARDGGLVPSGGARARLKLRAPVTSALGGTPLSPGQTYRVRYAVDNGRGLATKGPWRPFVFSPTAARQPAPSGAPSPRLRSKRGTRHRDRLIGTRGQDRLFGLAGNDVLDGRAGDDALDAGRGADRVKGGQGVDIIAGSSGRDRISGGPGRDVIDAGSGLDLVDARDGQPDTVDCGKGRDRVQADRRDRLIGCERRRR